MIFLLESLHLVCDITNPFMIRRRREAGANAEAEADPDADPYLLNGYGGHLAYPYHHHVPYLGLGLGHHLPYLHGYYAHTGCKNYLGATVPCL